MSRTPGPPRQSYNVRKALPEYSAAWFDTEHQAIQRALAAAGGGAELAGRSQIYQPIDTIDFRDVYGMSSQVDTAYPEWWGGFPGDGLAGAADVSPALQAAVKSGVRKILYGNGTYKHLGSVTVYEVPTSTDSIDIEGVNKLNSILQAGQSVLGAINALFLNQQNNGKLSFRRMRFSGQNGVTPFTGVAIYAQEDGINQAIFSGVMDDIWVGMGTAAEGFFKGGLNNYMVTKSSFEGTKTRFKLVGAGNADIHFDTISEYANYDEFLDLAQDAIEKNIISVRGYHSYSHFRGPLFSANNARAFTILGATDEVDDTCLPGTGLAFVNLKDCNQLHIGQSTVLRYPGSAVVNYDKVITLDGGSGEIDGQIVSGGDMCLAIKGAVNYTINGGDFTNAVSHILAFIGVTSGTIRLNGVKMRLAGLQLIKTLVAGSSFDLILEGCDILDAGYNAGAAKAGIEVETSGDVIVNGGRIGRQQGATSNMSGVFKLTGTGKARVTNAQLLGTAPIVDPASTQIPVIELTGAGTPEAVHTAAPGSTFHRTDGGAGTGLYVKETGVGNVGWVAK